MIKLHLGCGHRDFGKDWIHIDAGDYSHLDYSSIQDLRQFEDNTVDIIYASHVIEYFDRDEINHLLKEWKRILKPNCTLRLAVPNFEAMSYLYSTKRISLKDILGPLYGKMKMGNMQIYHKTVYDFDEIKTILQKNGFKDVKRFDWRKTEHSKHDDHSQAYIPHMNKDNGTLISLNVEAFK